MGVVEVIKIETCRDCRHISHTGGFTKGGAKPCCNHDETCATKGNDCFKRVIKDIKKIPGWCPLRPKTPQNNQFPKLPKGYGVFKNYSPSEKSLMVGVMDFLLQTETAPATMSYDGKKYTRGDLMAIPRDLQNLCCSCREYIEVENER